MKVSLLILLSSVSFNLFAQDCGEIADGTVSRLDEPGKSLANARVQDQDGLGTCYANTASLMLQSAMPDHPEISYLQLSINRAETVVQKDYRSQGKSQAFKDNGDLLIEAGFSCETINLAKDNGGVCERKNVALEQMMFKTDLNQFSDPSWIQMDLLKRVSTYYDGMLRDFSTSRGTGSENPDFETKTMEKRAPGKRSFFAKLFGTDDNQSSQDSFKNSSLSKDERNEKFAQYKTLLTKVIDENRDKYARRKCEKVDTANSMKVAQNLMMRIQNNLNAQKYKKFPEVKYKLFQLKMGSAYNYKINGVPTVEVKMDNRFTKMLEDVYLKTLTDETKKPENALQVFKDMLYKLDPTAPRKMIDELVADFSADDKDLLNQDYKRYVQKDFSACAPTGKLEYLASDDGLLKDFIGSGCSTDFIKHVKNLQQMVIGLDKYNFDNIDRLNDFISNLPNMSYDTAMMQLLAPDCSDEKKIKIPRDVTCSVKRLTYPGSKNDDEATTERHLAPIRKDFMKTSLKSINGDKAIGLSMCTGFYDKESANAFYTKTNECDTSKKHGFHAVTMIGYKCEKGKMKYLIQNSWGSWDSANGRFEKDSHGKAWLGEDELIKNTYRMDIMD